MKITTLHRAPSGKFFTSLQAGREACGLVNLYPYPAVELDNGTFRLIDSDAIVAADREVIIFSCPKQFPGLFFASVQDIASLVFANSPEGVACHWTWQDHKAIPLPDGTYRRVREGDVVRLWEPPTVAKADASPRAVPFDELDEPLKAAVMAVASFGATQAAPESVEKPKPIGLYTWGGKLGNALWVRKIGHRYERHEEVTSDTIHFSTFAEARQFLRGTLFDPAGMHAGLLPEQKTVVTATPESQAGAEQDAVSPEILERIRRNDERIKACGEAAKDSRISRELWQRVTELSFQMKSILSLPAGPARAEAKLKLIGEISKL